MADLLKFVIYHYISPILEFFRGQWEETATALAANLNKIFDEVKEKSAQLKLKLGEILHWISTQKHFALDFHLQFQKNRNIWWYINFLQELKQRCLEQGEISQDQFEEETRAMEAKELNSSKAQQKIDQELGIIHKEKVFDLWQTDLCVKYTRSTILSVFTTLLLSPCLICSSNEFRNLVQDTAPRLVFDCTVPFCSSDKYVACLSEYKEILSCFLQSVSTLRILFNHRFWKKIFWKFRSKTAKITRKIPNF